MSGSVLASWTNSSVLVSPPQVGVRLFVQLGPATVRVTWGDGDVQSFNPNTITFGFDLAHTYDDGTAAPLRAVVRGTFPGFGFAQEVLTIFLQGNETDAILHRGTNLDDLVQTGLGADSVRGFGGDDLLAGGAGNDTLLGEAGADLLLSGEGDDSLRGGAGNDTADGALGSDTVRGEDGDDSANGAGGDDLLYGGAGNDTLLGDSFVLDPTSNDILYGDTGDDVLSGGDGNDTLFGGAGNDALRGGNGNDKLYGGLAVDYFEASAGVDLLVTDDDDVTDSFYFGSTSFNQSRILGFESGVDQIRLAFLFDIHFVAGSTPLVGAPAETNLFYDIDDGRLFVKAPFETTKLFLRFLDVPTLGADDFVI